MVISCCCFAEDGTELFLSACRTCSTLIFPRSANQSLHCCVVVAVDVVDAKTPFYLFFFCYRAIEIVWSFACIITSELSNQLHRLEALFTCSLLSSAGSSRPITGRQLGRSLGRRQRSCRTVVPCSGRKESTEKAQGKNGFPKERTTQIGSTSADG